MVDERLSTVNHVRTSVKKQKPILIVVAGCKAVGKTSLIKRFTKEPFPKEHKPTTEEYIKMTYEYRHLKLPLAIIDTSGSYEFPAMLELNIRKADVIMLVYDIGWLDSTLTFLMQLFQTIRHLREIGSVPIIIIGNKMDLRKDDGDYDDDVISNFLKNSNDTRHILTSAKINLNINEAFNIGLDGIENIRQRSENYMVTEEPREEYPRMKQTCPVCSLL